MGNNVVPLFVRDLTELKRENLAVSVKLSASGGENTEATQHIFLEKRKARLVRVVPNGSVVAHNSLMSFASKAPPRNPAIQPSDEGTQWRNCWRSWMVGEVAPHRTSKAMIKRASRCLKTHLLSVVIIAYL